MQFFLFFSYICYPQKNKKEKPKSVLETINVICWRDHLNCQNYWPFSQTRLDMKGHLTTQDTNLVIIISFFLFIVIKSM